MIKLLKYLKPYRISAFLGLLFKFAETVFEVLLPVIMAQLITRVITTKSFDGTAAPVFLMLGIIVINIVMAVLGQYFATRSSVLFGRDLRRILFDKINQLSYKGLDSFGTSSLTNRLINDTLHVQNAVFWTVRVGSRAPFLAIGSFVMALVLDVGISMVFLFTIPIIGLVLFYVIRKTIPLYDGLAKQLDSVTMSVSENYSGSRVIRSYSAQQREIKRFENTTSAYRDSAVHVGRLSALINPAATFVMQMGIVLILFLGGSKVYSGALMPAQIAAFITYMLQILLAMMVLANLIILFTRGTASGNRINAVLDSTDTEIPYPGTLCGTVNAPADSPGKISAGKECTNIANAAGGISSGMAAGTVNAAGGIGNDMAAGGVGSGMAADTVSAANGIGSGMAAGMADNASEGTEKTSAGDSVLSAAHIEYKNVSFGYGGTSEIVKDISFSIKLGESLGIIGSTGSGKTTLVNLLPRFYNAQSGQILINGQDIAEMDLISLRRIIGIVPQKTQLFKGTIQDNITMGDEGITEEDIHSALKIAQARFVLRYADKLSRAVEQGGSNYSGGQRQRLTIARAIAKRPEILILDDSSSALDFKTDAALFRAIKSKLPGVTTIIISQRIFSIMRADKILVLENGTAVGYGTHQELLNTCGVYREIYNSQTA